MVGLVLRWFAPRGLVSGLVVLGLRLFCCA